MDTDTLQAIYNTLESITDNLETIEPKNEYISGLNIALQLIYDMILDEMTETDEGTNLLN